MLLLQTDSTLGLLESFNDVLRELHGRYEVVRAINTVEHEASLLDIYTTLYMMEEVLTLLKGEAQRHSSKIPVKHLEALEALDDAHGKLLDQVHATRQVLRRKVANG